MAYLDENTGRIELSEGDLQASDSPLIKAAKGNDFIGYLANLEVEMVECPACGAAYDKRHPDHGCKMQN